MQIDSDTTDDGLRQAWVQFSAADSYEEYCQYWLELMCTRIGGVSIAALVLESGEAGFQPTAIWPEKSQTDEEFTALIEEGLEEAAGLVHTLASGGYGVAFPIRLDDELVGVVALSLRVNSIVLPAVMEQIQWGSAWIELLLRRHRGREKNLQFDRLSGAVDLLGAVLVESDFNSAAMTFVNELAAALSCDRVSFGLTKGTLVEVTTLSHSAQFGKKMNLIRRLSGVMDEAVQQRGVINYPNTFDSSSLLVEREHAQFSQSYGNANILTIPLHSGTHYFGAVTLERPADNPFSEDEITQIRSVVALSGETLRNKQNQDKTWYQHLISACGQHVKKVLGSGYLGRKLSLILLAAVVVFFSVANGTYRVSGDSLLEGSVRRAIVAPFEGYLESADVKAGERVTQGQEMSSLDDRDLTLEKLSYLSEQAKLQRQYEEAVAKRERAEAAVIQTQLEQNRAQLKLVESKLSRTRLRAPFDGIVISGDLSQRLGGAIEQGEVLFEVAPLDSYRVILWVDEHRMADITEQQQGHLVLNSLPETTSAFKVTQVTPVTEARDGGNYFRVEAVLVDSIPEMRPGMKGVGKIEVDERKLIWIWTYPALQWFKLKLWSWWP
ncbi:HlyD family efflux transporter periplasmic adaptor subunit [Neptunomonas sp.]|uniref:HlyD family efflux transporter periplasmic adaptor subunit n=1 Tax=Neptunomonas sp. TaxID=1971898 RepID=UPI003566F75D